MLKHPQIQQIAELPDETIFSFDSVQDFVDSLLPKKGSIEEIEQFLHAHDFVLNAKRRINIFRPKQDFFLLSSRANDAACPNAANEPRDSFPAFTMFENCPSATGRRNGPPLRMTLKSSYAQDDL